MKNLTALVSLSCLVAPAFAQERLVAFELVDSAAGPQPNIAASSTPTLGRLFPLSSFLSVNAFGNVGMGTTNPAGALEVYGENSGSSFRVFDFPGGNGTHLVAGLVGAGGQGPQMRFEGAGGFIDIGQDGFGAFVVEGNDAARLRITNGGLAAINFPVYSNVRLGVANADNFNLYAENTHGADVFVSGIYGAVTDTAATGYGAGVWGRSASPNRAAVVAEGDSVATGTKSFVQPHPTDASKQIHFVCLEGNESGTYFRGKTRLAGGSAVIDVPEDFRLVSEADNLTVQLTPMGDARVWLESYDLDRVVIGGTGDVEVHYMVNGVRRGYADLETIRPNTAYVPRSPEAFGTQYPQAIREMLVENGTLDPDYTPNRSTAARLGWDLTIQPAGAEVQASPRR